MTATLQRSARLIGRGPELEILYGLIDRVPERGCALVIRGEPGVGKTSLLVAANRRATTRASQRQVDTKSQLGLAFQLSL